MTAAGAKLTYRLLKFRTQCQDTDVEVEVDNAIGDIGTLEITHSIEELAHSQSTVNMAATQGRQRYDQTVGIANDIGT